VLAAHRHRVHRGEARVGGGRHEPRPARRLGLHVGHRDGLPGGVAVQAGALVGLQLEQLQVVELLRGGGHQLQTAARGGEQQSRRRDIQQLRALLGELGEQVNNVVVVEQTVHQRDDRVQDAGFTRYLGHYRLHSAPVTARRQRNWCRACDERASVGLQA
jgi:hypothetical protein